MQVFYTANKKVIRDDLKVVKCTKINHQVDKVTTKCNLQGGSAGSVHGPSVHLSAQCDQIQLVWPAQLVSPISAASLIRLL